jgi:hypothetical protein
MVPAEVEAVSKKPGHAVEAGGDEQIGPTRELASFVARLRYEDIPAEVITKAKACLSVSIFFLCEIINSELLPFDRYK